MSDQTKNVTENRANRPRKPFLLKFLIWAFSFCSLLGWLRFIRAVMERDLVLEFFSNALYIYFLTAGLVWGLTALPVIWGLLRGTHWARPLTWVAAILFPAMYWFERLALWQDQSSQSNWLFMALLTLIWFGLVVWAMQIKSSREYFSAGKRRK